MTCCGLTPGLRRLELDEVQRIGKAAVDDSHHAHELAQAAWPVDGERLLAFSQGEGLEHSRQPQPVVGVEVGDEHALHVDQADRAQQLALRPFAAVEQQAIASAAYQQGGQASPRAWHRTAGAEEE
jgi:hypothetical protein